MNAVVHPRWCSTGICEASLGGAHTSVTMRIGRDGASSARLQLRLWQPSVTIDGPPLVEIVTGSHDDGHRCRTDVSLAQASLLHTALASLLGKAGAK